MIFVKLGDKCPHGHMITVASTKCKKCEHHLNSELVLDDHGRIEEISIDCKLEHNDKL